MCMKSAGDFLLRSTGIPQIRDAMNGDMSGIAGTMFGVQGAPKSWGLDDKVGGWVGMAAPKPVEPAKYTPMDPNSFYTPAELERKRTKEQLAAQAAMSPSTAGGSDFYGVSGGVSPLQVVK